MLCIAFGSNNGVIMSFGKDLMYEPTINNLLNIQMNNEYYFFVISTMIYIYIFFAKKELFVSKKSCIEVEMIVFQKI